MPSYNQGEFIEKAINSVLIQTYQNWELIIIDNNSNDFTRDVLKNIQDIRIKIYKVNNNGVISYSRNIGLANSKGDWITFLDTDDIWYENRLEEILKVLNMHPKIDIISNDEYVRNLETGNKKIQRYGPNRSNLYQKMLLFGNVFSTSSIAIKRDLFNNLNIKFDESKDIVTAEDYDLWLKLVFLNPNIYFSRVITGEYILHNSNNSKNFANHFNAIQAVLYRHIFEIQDFELNKNSLFDKVQIRMNIIAAFNAFKLYNLHGGVKLILTSFFKNPVHFFKVFFHLIN